MSQTAEKPLLDTTKVIGRFRSMQVCLDCKKAGKFTAYSTVMEVASHIITEHGDE